MKILLFTDNHFCENFSIVQKFGTKYSVRLENQIQSLNWVEGQALKNNCEAVICLGDFFDRPELNEQEITAVKDISWNSLPHYFIVGNHESSISTLQYNSVKILEGQNHFIIDQPSKLNIPNLNCEVCFLPYIIESDRKSLVDYFGPYNTNRVILSHNDLKGIQMGPVISREGFDIEDIDHNCNLFINGHLHNGQKVSAKAINLGNLTGKDFGENAARYTHNIMILDTDSLTYELIENPYAFNFYKLEINSASDINKLNNLKSNAVISVKCLTSLLDKTKTKIAELSNLGKIIESRLIISHIMSDNIEAENNIADLTVDHLAEFIKCCREKINNTTVLDDELSEICK